MFNTIYIPGPKKPLDPSVFMRKRMPEDKGGVPDFVNGVVNAVQQGPIGPQLLKDMGQAAGINVIHQHMFDYSNQSTQSQVIQNVQNNNDNRTWNINIQPMIQQAIHLTYQYGYGRRRR